MASRRRFLPSRTTRLLRYSVVPEKCARRCVSVTHISRVQSSLRAHNDQEQTVISTQNLEEKRQCVPLSRPVSFGVLRHDCIPAINTTNVTTRSEYGTWARNETRKEEKGQKRNKYTCQSQYLCRGLFIWRVASWLCSCNKYNKRYNALRIRNVSTKWNKKRRKGKEKEQIYLPKSKLSILTAKECLRKWAQACLHSTRRSSKSTCKGKSAAMKQANQYKPTLQHGVIPAVFPLLQLQQPLKKSANHAHAERGFVADLRNWRGGCEVAGFAATKTNMADGEFCSALCTAVKLQQTREQYHTRKRELRYLVLQCNRKSCWEPLPCVQKRHKACAKSAQMHPQPTLGGQSVPLLQPMCSW